LKTVEESQVVQAFGQFALVGQPRQVPLAEQGHSLLAQGDGAAMAREAGARDFLLKPIDPDKMMDKIRRAREDARFLEPWE